MGFARFAELTHEIENVLDLLRAERLKVANSITDRLLAGIDALSQMASMIGNGEGDDLECAPLVKALRDAAQESGAESGSTTSGAEAQSLNAEAIDALILASQQAPIYEARFRLAADCVMKFARAFMAINSVQAEGELLACTPDQDKLEEEEFEQDFRLIFHYAGDLEALRTDFSRLSEVEAFSLEAWQAPAAEAQPAENPKEGPAPAQMQATPKKADLGQTVRVDVARLDALMNLVGELVIDRTRIAQISQELINSHEDPRFEALQESIGHVARITVDLQDQIMKARMMPVEVIFNRLPRVVRDLAQNLGKDIKLEMEGAETELDRTVIELIGDPILHVLRNSLDHGLETPNERIKAGKPAQGSLRLSASHQENHIVIQIRDDGRGIHPDRIRAKAVEKGLLSEAAAERLTDKEAIQLIFSSGFSTAEQVSEVSGRGVGMDIVRSNVQKVGGMIDIDSEPGRGTAVSLRLPLTLAIIRGLLVRQSGLVYVVPLASVIETLALTDEMIQRINRREVVVIRGVTTPLIRLSRALRSDGRESEDQHQAYAVIVGLGDQRLGVVVDELVGEQEVVIKSISRFCGDVGAFNGATILGDGRVALILDVAGLAEQSRGA
jgi:two-component system chemotaxis sensor kinase CheA